MTCPARSPLRVAITGAFGLIGSYLLQQLIAAGHTAIPIRRISTPTTIDPQFAQWNPDAGSLLLPPNVDVLIHLAGKNVAARWTRKAKTEIWKSRVDATHSLALALAKMPPEFKPKLLLSASATGIYGNRGDEPLTESSPIAPPKNSYLADICRGWEDAAKPAADASIRIIHARIGVVLSKQGGALKKMLTPVKICLAGPIGNGLQWMPWISLSDASHLLISLAQSTDFSGIINLVDGSVRQHEFMRTLGRILHRPTIFPLPAFMVKLIFGEMGREILLASQHVTSTRLPPGFQFQHTNLEDAIRAELNKPCK